VDIRAHDMVVAIRAAVAAGTVDELGQLLPTIR
jgi:hypothetical protein